LKRRHGHDQRPEGGNHHKDDVPVLIFPDALPDAATPTRARLIRAPERPMCTAGGWSQRREGNRRRQHICP